MDTNPNNAHPQDNVSSRSLAREGREPAAPNATQTAGAKLKEAQAKLMEAEAKLMGANANPGASAATPSRPMPTNESRPKPPPSNANAGTNVSDKNDTAAKVESAKPAGAKEQTPSKPITEHLSENVAGMLCYLFGWASGLVFLFIDRRPFVRFHAAQSVAIFATLNILILALSGFFLGALIPGIAGALVIVSRALELVWLVAAVVLVLKVAGGERYRVKMASEYGDRAARNVGG
jgi:uncharacterized membrane protein